MPRLMASSQEPAKMMRVIFTPWTSIRLNSGFTRMAMRSKPFIARPRLYLGGTGLAGRSVERPPGTCSVGVISM